ncbi:MAG: exodeoxyribonuclease III [Pseudomonadota bacterium]
MIIATWNINGIKARLEVLKAWLKEASPDVVCLQEIKSIDENFPAGAIEELGYNVATHGQKGFNGVAILSKRPFDELIPRLPGDESDEQARYLEAVISGDEGTVRVASIYLPNGNPVETEKYPYKLSWMDRLIAHAQSRLADEEPLVLAGDYNVIPQDGDCYSTQAWAEDALALPQTRNRFRTLLGLGFTDALRAVTPEEGIYTFWDYQAGAWQRNNGIRIDHLLLSPQAADRLKSCETVPHVRGWEKPSDHIPVWIDLAV